MSNMNHSNHKESVDTVLLADWCLTFRNSVMVLPSREECVVISDMLPFKMRPLRCLEPSDTKYL